MTDYRIVEEYDRDLNKIYKAQALGFFFWGDVLEKEYAGYAVRWHKSLKAAEEYVEHLKDWDLKKKHKKIVK